VEEGKPRNRTKSHPERKDGNKLPPIKAGRKKKRKKWYHLNHAETYARQRLLEEKKSPLRKVK
jgi:hypothetical protein